MRSTRTVYVSTQAEYDKHKEKLKQTACPGCRVVGCLIRHGYLKGHGEEANDEVRRGWRVFCSNRRRRKGCGRTYSILLAKFIFRRMITAPMLWQLLQGLRKGLSIKAAWEKVASPFGPDTGYRLRQAFARSQTFIRARLLRIGAVPKMPLTDPVLQVIEHLLAVFPTSACPVADFQLRFQTAFLTAPGVNRSG